MLDTYYNEQIRGQNLELCEQRIWYGWQLHEAKCRNKWARRQTIDIRDKYVSLGWHSIQLIQVPSLTDRKILSGTLFVWVWVSFSRAIFSCCVSNWRITKISFSHQTFVGRKTCCLASLPWVSPGVVSIALLTDLYLLSNALSSLRTVTY